MVQNMLRSATIVLVSCGISLLFIIRFGSRRRADQTIVWFSDIVAAADHTMV